METGIFSFAVISFCGIVGAMAAFLTAAKVADDVFGQGPSARKFAASFKAFNLTPSFSRAYVSATLLSDWVFGTRLISVRAIVVSGLITTFWLLALAATSLALYGKGSWFFNSVFSNFVVGRFWGFLLVGMIIDYLSMCMTRKLLLYAVDKNALTKISMLTVDIVASISIFYVLYSTARFVILQENSFMSLSDSLQSWFSGIFDLQLRMQFLTEAELIPDGPGSYKILNGNTEVIYAFPEGMIFMSSLLTTFWIFAHIFAYGLYGAARGLTSSVRALIDQASIDSKPILSIALIMCMGALGPIWLIAMLLYSLHVLH